MLSYKRQLSKLALSLGCLLPFSNATMAVEASRIQDKDIVFAGYAQDELTTSFYSAALKKADILLVGNKVMEWQMSYYPTQGSTREPDSWLNGALYLGVMDWADLTGDKKYDQWLQQIFNKLKWRPAYRMYHADDICISQTYLDMYRKHKKKSMYNPTEARAEWVVNHPSQGEMDLNYGKPSSLERWSWCDALFMSPPVYARMYAMTGDKKYMDFALKEYKVTYDKLFDKEEHLFYRDSNYFNKKEANGKKIFWGRGNGWVLGGLVEMLKELPADDKIYRPYFKDLYVEMCDRIVGLQSKDGFWRASLLDPDSYPAPETSATGFITYALAYGVNQGILPKDKFMPAVEKGWKALVDSVAKSGRLCWVQPVGADPKHVKKENTEVYGVGAFLLTAAEMYKLSQ